jgi:hypothetical protein
LYKINCFTVRGKSRRPLRIWNRNYTWAKALGLAFESILKLLFIAFWLTEISGKNTIQVQTANLEKKPMKFIIEGI